MSKLTSEQRNAMPSGEFAGPGRSYPVPDASHARNALARASQMEHAGKISESTKAKIDAKANAVLHQGEGHKPSGDQRHTDHWSKR